MKVWCIPELTVYGSVEQITQQDWNDKKLSGDDGFTWECEPVGDISG